MKFYVALLSFVPTIQRKLIKKEFEGSIIELAENLLVKYNVYYKDKELVPYLYFGNFIVGNDNELLAGDIGRRSKVNIIEYEDGKFRDEELETYPNIHFIWDRQNQLVFFEVDTLVFNNYESLIKQMEKHLSDLLEQYEYTVYIEPLTAKAEFWNTVRSFEHLYGVTFVMHMPNFLGKTQEEIKNVLTEYRNGYNATSLTTKISNTEGKLKIEKNDLSLNQMLEWITKGAGLWRLQGIQWGKNKKLTISSRAEEYMKNVETSLEFENYTPEEVKNVLNSLSPSSLMDDSKDEISKK